ncbi:MAG: DNA-directed RNA polymerase subunit B [Nitrososphaerales archaeon]
MRENIEYWPVLESLLEKEGITRQHLSSYNEFINKGMQSIIDEVGSVEIENPMGPYKIKLGKVFVETPSVVEIDGSTKSRIFPQQARLRNLSYSAPIKLQMTIVENDVEKDNQFFWIGDLPIMVRSEKCSLFGLTEQQLIEEGEDVKDPGGYFIINGSERVIVGLEDLTPNKVLVDKEVTGDVTVYKAKVYSSIVGYRIKLEITLKQDGSILIKVPGCPVDLPFVIVIRALGIERDKDIAEAVSFDTEILNFLEVAFDKATEAQTTQEAILYIGNRAAPGMIDELRLKKANILLDWELLPHLGRSPKDRFDKAMFLADAVCKLIELRLGWIEPDDKDHYGNKVIKFAGEMLAELFRTAFRNLMRDIKYQLDRSTQKRSLSLIGAAIRPGIITDKLNNALATGNWGKGKVGVTQLLDRTNHLSTISHLRRIQSPLSRTQPNFEARDLHPTHFGRICPNETPEGSNCGLVKNLALSAIISVAVSQGEIIDKLYELGVIPINEAEKDLKIKGCKVFVEGRFIGYHEDGEELCKLFRALRRQGKIHPHASISYQPVEHQRASKRLYVGLGAGRVLRPLVVVKNGKPLLNEEMVRKVKNREISWEDLLRMGVIELIDASEEENCFIALDKSSLNDKHTHLELVPSAILGVSASAIPYPEHNQSPRNTYESAMIKQAVGFPSPILPFILSARQQFLVYSQKPLVTTKAIPLLGLNERGLGQNCIVAVLSFEGYNIEDAIIINKSAVERGLARSFFYRLYEAEAKQYLGGMSDSFEVPSAEANVRGYRGERYYRLLEGDGAVMHEAKVSNGDVLIGRTSPPRFMEEYKEFEVRGPYKRDTSVATRPLEQGVVDGVFLTQSIEGGKMYRVRVRDMRIPEIGDKFASRHGQKGVIGMLISQEDMPYTEQGIVPDIIINPHAFPSRMTVGQFLESIAGKCAALRGKEVDATAFEGEDINYVFDLLESLGFKKSGKEVMYDGKTGKKYNVEIFIGLVYYQKLHHMVADKLHARARGQVQMLTKQPTEGRARGGGLRFGEMERDCLIAYGASMLLKDRLLDESDRTEIYICENCGLIAYYDVRQRRHICRLCGDAAKISQIVVAYAFKLLLQEMMSLNIAPRLKLRDKV